MARAVKDKFGKAVINAGNSRDPEIVEKILESGDVDIVGMGRGLIAGLFPCLAVREVRRSTAGGSLV